LSVTAIEVDWDMGESVWRTAGKAFRAYAMRRAKQRHEKPRRILADFLIGAHAVERNCKLMTFDGGLFREAFPYLDVMLL
jgi:hypothetical protein